MIKNDFPIIGKLYNSKEIHLLSYEYIHFIINARKFSDIKYNLDKDLVTMNIIDKNTSISKTIKFFGGISNGDLLNVICAGDYDDMPVFDKTVVDIGSNIGDSPIFFALNGAKKVIAFEPFPKIFELSIQNIDVNSLSQKILVNLAGCSSKNEIITIDPKFNSKAGTSLTHFSEGIQVPLFTLHEIIKKYQVPKNSILKIDCEGCEYDIINESSSDTLRHFSHIKIEYHFGYKNLEKKLKQSGFEVSISPPIATNVFNAFFTKSDQISQNFNKIGYVGFLTATQIKL